MTRESSGEPVVHWFPSGESAGEEYYLTGCTGTGHTTRLFSWFREWHRHCHDNEEDTP